MRLVNMQKSVKTVRNNLLAEADIAAEEALFKLRNDLEKTRDYNNILDGDNPRWISGSMR